jgi:hypothetical protein
LFRLVKGYVLKVPFAIWKDELLTLASLARRRKIVLSP